MKPGERCSFHPSYYFLGEWEGKKYWVEREPRRHYYNKPYEEMPSRGICVGEPGGRTFIDIPASALPEFLQMEFIALLLQGI